MSRPPQATSLSVHEEKAKRLVTLLAEHAKQEFRAAEKREVEIRLATRERSLLQSKMELAARCRQA